jgi:spore germination cell wall hydrolase CwlJ-like protein
MNSGSQRRKRRPKAANIYFDAAHEPLDGKLAVAQVTLNRV